MRKKMVKIDMRACYTKQKINLTCPKKVVSTFYKLEMLPMMLLCMFGLLIIQCKKNNSKCATFIVEN